MSGSTQDRSAQGTPSHTERLLAERANYRHHVEHIVTRERSHPGAWPGSAVPVHPQALTVLVWAGVLRYEGWELGRQLYRLVDLDEARDALEAWERGR